MKRGLRRGVHATSRPQAVHRDQPHLDTHNDASSMTLERKTLFEYGPCATACAQVSVRPR